VYKAHWLILQVDNNEDYIIEWEDVNAGYMSVSVIPERHDGMESKVKNKS
jgi:hypothetical protein